MARWRKHNRRADKKRRMPYARFKRLRKAARFGLMYGMGTKKLIDSFGQIGMTMREAVRQVDSFRETFNRVDKMFEDPGIQATVQTVARDRGDTVIKHNAYDASIFVVPGVPSKIVDNKT